MKDKIIDNILYVSIALCMAAQVVIGPSYILGQTLFLLANTINLVRTFLLKRPLSDKVKDVCFWGLTVGLIIHYFV